MGNNYLEIPKGAEIYTKKEIAHNTKMLLYYMGKIAERLKQGESPIIWLGEIVKYSSNLQAYYEKADFLDIWESLDFGEIYQKALEQAQQEIEND